MIVRKQVFGGVAKRKSQKVKRRTYVVGMVAATWSQKLTESGIQRRRKSKSQSRCEISHRPWQTCQIAWKSMIEHSCELSKYVNSKRTLKLTSFHVFVDASGPRSICKGHHPDHGGFLFRRLGEKWETKVCAKPDFWFFTYKKYCKSCRDSEFGSGQTRRIEVLGSVRFLEFGSGCPLIWNNLERRHDLISNQRNTPTKYLRSTWNCLEQFWEHSNEYWKI